MFPNRHRESFLARIKREFQVSKFSLRCEESCQFQFQFSKVIMFFVSYSRFRLLFFLVPICSFFQPNDIRMTLEKVHANSVADCHDLTGKWKREGIDRPSTAMKLLHFDFWFVISFGIGSFALSFRPPNYRTNGRCPVSWVVSKCHDPTRPWWRQ